MAAGAFEGMITGLYLPGGSDGAAPSGYLEPADQWQAGCYVQDHPYIGGSVRLT